MRLIYDLTIQPFSVGDMLTHQQAALIMGITDTLIVYDPEWKMDRALSGIEPSRDMKWLIESARANGKCRSVDVALKRFHRTEPGDWPQATNYTTYKCWELCSHWYAQHGKLPELSPSQEMIEWAVKYLRENGRVTVQARRNRFNPKRNSDYGEWSRFFGNHRNEKFVLICSDHERDRTLECFQNVTWADCDMERKLALVWAADFHMGVSSGPAQMRWYGQSPFSTFNEGVDPNRVCGMTVENRVKKMPWMNAGQRLLPYQDTYDEIEAEYALHGDRGFGKVGIGDRADLGGSGRRDNEYPKPDQLPRFRSQVQGFA